MTNTTQTFLLAFWACLVISHVSPDEASFWIPVSLVNLVFAALSERLAPKPQAKDNTPTPNQGT